MTSTRHAAAAAVVAEADAGAWIAPYVVSLQSLALVLAIVPEVDVMRWGIAVNY